jgi:hypothetical protein
MVVRLKFEILDIYFSKVRGAPKQLAFLNSEVELNLAFLVHAWRIFAKVFCRHALEQVPVLQPANSLFRVRLENSLKSTVLNRPST